MVVVLFSAVLDRRVLAAGWPSALGRVEDLVVDPQTTRIVALCLAGGAPGDVVHWADLSAVSPYALMARSRWCAGPARGRVAELLDCGHRIFRKRLLTAAGELIGSVTDVEFDALTGEATWLMTEDGVLPGHLLVAAGSHAVVVHHPVARPADRLQTVMGMSSGCGVAAGHAADHGRADNVRNRGLDAAAAG